MAPGGRFEPRAACPGEPSVLTLAATAAVALSGCGSEPQVECTAGHGDFAAGIISAVEQIDFLQLLAGRCGKCVVEFEHCVDVCWRQ